MNSREKNREEMMQVSGGCHCGRVLFEAIVDPSQVRICHCNDCQIISGTAFRLSLPVENEDFELTKGELKTYVKIAESGNKRAQCFCENCGSHIYATSVDDPKILNIRVGTVEQRRLLAPHSEKFTSEAMPWLEGCKLV